MSGGCWNYMNDSTANEILGYHIYVGYGLDSERHEKNYRMVVREKPLGRSRNLSLSYTMYSAFFTHMIGLVHDGFRCLSEGRGYLQRPLVQESTSGSDQGNDRHQHKKLKEELYTAFGLQPESSDEL